MCIWSLYNDRKSRFFYVRLIHAYTVLLSLYEYWKRCRHYPYISYVLYYIVLVVIMIFDNIILVSDCILLYTYLFFVIGRVGRVFSQGRASGE